MTRALEPAATGHVERDGVRLAWERFGEGRRSVFFVPTWTIVHSRIWKMQVPYLARHFTVVTFDPRGNGRSDRPSTGYSLDDHYLDTLAVLDAVELEKPAVVSLSRGANPAVLLAARRPERVERLALVAPALYAARARTGDFWAERESYEGWEKSSAPYWLSNYEDFLWFFFTEVFSEPHSTKPIEDAVGWGLETTGELLVQQEREYDKRAVPPLLPEIRCPTLIVHGSDDGVIPLSVRRARARRDPRRTARRDRGCRAHPERPRPGEGQPAPARLPRRGRAATRAAARARATPPAARALRLEPDRPRPRAARPGDRERAPRGCARTSRSSWLAQHPVTAVLEAAGETVHPASRQMANESAHIESEMGEHDLHVFQAWREMDEILLANFMLFHDVVRDDHYDLWLGDESWELDYYLHENPELKTAPYAFMTDFVGWLPIDDAPGLARGLRRGRLQRREHPARRALSVRARRGGLRRLEGRRRAARTSGPSCRSCRTGSSAISRSPATSCPSTRPTSPTPSGSASSSATTPRGRSSWRASAARASASTCCGASRRRSASSAKDVPEARLLLVCGPRIDPAAIEPVEGMTAVGYVHDLFRTLACCDLAVVQGGLTTTMELVANRRPFISIPLRNHFEQNHHVVHRLRQYGAPEPTPLRRGDARHGSPRRCSSASARPSTTSPSRPAAPLPPPR